MAIASTLAAAAPGSGRRQHQRADYIGDGASAPLRRRDSGLVFRLGWAVHVEASSMSRRDSKTHCANGHERYVEAFLTDAIDCGRETIEAIPTRNKFSFAKEMR
jgi:hypothetical protein